MKNIDTMTDLEVLEEIQSHQERLTESDFDAVEAGLKVKAACLNWTGDPLKQPPRSVLGTVRAVLEAKGILQ